MNKKFLTILGLIFITSLIIVSSVKALNLYYEASSHTGVASTTATFMIGGQATTTVTRVADGYQQISYLVSLGASTTAPTLCWKNQYSNNNTDWYTEDLVYASSTLHLTTEKEECWTYATTTTTNLISMGSNGVTLFVGRKIVVPNLDTQYVRTQFYLSGTGRGMLDVRTSLKNEVIKTK